MKIPFIDLKHSNLAIKDDLLKALLKVLYNGQLVLGEEVKRFEKSFAKFSNAKYCIGVSSGLDALCLSLESLNLDNGAEVILASNSYIATVNAVVRLGLTPIFVEPKEDTFNIDPSKIEPVITSKTKVILPTHFFGQACDMTSIKKIAKKHRLYIVEDNAQSQGSSYNGKKTGSFGEVNATSFYPTKNLGALGEAGAITTNNYDIYKKIMMLRNYGESSKYKNDIIGYNCRLDELQATFLNIKLKRLNTNNKKRIRIAKIYLKGLKNISDIQLPITEKGAENVYHIFPIKTNYRDKLKEHLIQKGIGVSVHYPIAPYLQKAYRYLGYKKGSFPIAERLARQTLSLPIYPELNEIQVDYVVEQIHRFYARLNKNVSVNDTILF